MLLRKERSDPDGKFLYVITYGFAFGNLRPVSSRDCWLAAKRRHRGAHGLEASAISHGSVDLESISAFRSR